MSLNNELEVTKNKLTTYFPIRTKDERKEFDWDSILGIFLADVYRKELKNSDFSNYTTLCESEFRQRLDDPSFWHILKDIYFENKNVLNIAPEFLLFKSEKKEDNRHNQRIGHMFMNISGRPVMDTLKPIQLNFIEKILFNVLVNQAIKPEGEVKKRLANEEVYLPYLARCFTADLNFLSKKPHYLLGNISQFLKLYGFLYTSQLSLNLLKWESGEPKPLPQYLILDVEKASQERREIRDYGYKQLLKHVHYIFPYLSMSEMLQSESKIIKPLWELAASIRCGNQSTHTDRLNEFASEFVKDRNLHLKVQDQESATKALQQVLFLSREQFKTGNKDKDDINNNYAKATLKSLCKDFIHHRGGSGSTLVINQDYLLLLTNISIGENETLRFNELLKEFEKRGVFFDRKSQEEIVQFFERIGNVERMSDSGDAVYVRKTV